MIKKQAFFSFLNPYFYGCLSAVLACFCFANSFTLTAQNTQCNCNIKIDSFTASLNDKYNQATNQESIMLELDSAMVWFLSTASPCCKSAGYSMKAAGNIGNEKEFRKYITISENLLKKYPFDYSYLENKRYLYYFYSSKLLYDSAIFYCMQGLKYAEEKKQENMVITFNLFLAEEFSKQKMYVRSLGYSKKSFQLAERNPTHQNAVYLAASYSIYANAQLAIYEKSKFKGLLDTVLFYTNKSLKVAKANDLPNIEWAAYQNLGRVSFIKQEYQKALDYSNKILDDPRLQLDPDAEMEAYQLRSKVYYELNDFDKVIESMEKVKELMGNAKPLYELETLGLLYKSYAKTGNYKLAYENLVRLKTINDSLVSPKNSRLITELEQKYEKTKNEQKIKDLRYTDNVKSLRIKILGLVLVGLILLAMAIYLLSRQRLLKNKQELLKTEQRLNRARMDPHFFFNALTSMQTMSMDENLQEKTTLYLSKFAKVMRQSLESTYDDLVTLDEEIDFLENYLQVQQFRNPDKFIYHIDIDPNMDTENTFIPGMIIQPFIENAIEHGFRAIDYQGKIGISIAQNKDKLTIEISDNGNGVKKEDTHKTYPSRAMQIVRDRLFLLDKEQKTSSNFQLIDNAEGMKVIITIPKINKT